jgi:hypothetical protein
MTAKEKAQELVGKFFNQVEDVSNYKELQKQCALIAVEEIMYSYPTDPYKTLQPTNIAPLVYWRKVKEEIEKL